MIHLPSGSLYGSRISAPSNNPSMLPTGTTAGQLVKWNGTSWVLSDDGSATTAIVKPLQEEAKQKTLYYDVDSGVITYADPSTDPTGNVTSTNPALTGNNTPAEYVASASFNNTDAWHAFTQSNADGLFWNTGTQYNSGNGNYGGATTTTVDGLSIGGDWVQLEVNVPPSNTGIEYRGIDISGRTDQQFVPNQILVAGSSDGVTWTAVHQFEYYNSGAWQSYIPSPVVRGYDKTYFRIIVRTTQSSSTSASIASCRLYFSSNEAVPGGTPLGAGQEVSNIDTLGV